LYGEGAIISIKDLSPIVKKLEQLNLEVIKIERVDSRRWNIYIKQGYFIKLPNFNPINAIDYLYQLNNNINYTNLYSIDLRIENRISLKYN
jgi:cell division septal protein FtsQ